MEEKYEDLHEDMYKSYYKNAGKSKLLKKIWVDAFGDNYPEGLNNFGFVTNKDLELISKYLEAKPDSSLLDIGCGTGGPGIKIAEQNDLKLKGIDIVSEAIEQAEILKNKFKLTHEAQFQLGGFCDIPFSDSSISNIISIDAFWMVHEKKEALTEMKRVLQQGGKFIFTTWDSILQDPLPLFKECGFSVISREETVNWKQYQLQVYKDILKHKNELLAEIGKSAKILISEATSVPPMLEVTKRYLYHTQVN
jgi:ubiquinone/menaquinone biosynthesis C-methylase UbiE